MEGCPVITGLQLVAIVFALVMIYLAYLNYRRQEIGKLEFISWWTIWVGATIIIIFPDLLRGFASSILITRVFDLMVIGGFILVITLAYKAYVKSKSLEKKIERFVREKAIKESENVKR